MRDYLNFNLLAFSVGVIDYVLKGEGVWNKLPSFYQSWSWHIGVFLLYSSLLLLYLGSRKSKLYPSPGNLTLFISGLLLFINEDVFYYLIKTIDLNSFCYNQWLFSDWTIYLFLIILLNFSSIFLLKWKK